jgi:cysteine desulfurase
VSGIRADALLFTSGATEANNLALLGLAGSPPARVIISSIEHPSVAGPAEELERRGFTLERLRVSRDGVVDVEHLRELLAEQPAAPMFPVETRLVSVMLGNNETGVLQPVQQLAALCRAANVPLHTDATQVVGKLPVDFRALGASALAFSGHKFHGPPGIGGLLLHADLLHGDKLHGGLRSGPPLQPLHFGGFQQAGLRPGTEAVAPAAALHAALEIFHAEAAERGQRMAALRDRFEALLRAELPNIEIHGARVPRLPHTSGIAFPGLDRQALQMALDLAGVACSTGSACASGSSEPSPVLLAMGCERAQIEGSLRFSLGAFTTADEVNQAARRISKIVNDLQNQKSPRKTPLTSRT